MKRILFLTASVLGMMTLAVAAQAVDLDQTVCEDDLGGAWTSGTSTCDVGFLFSTPDPLVVPAGVTLTADFADLLDPQVSNFGTIVIEFDWHNHGQLDNYGSFTADAMIHDTVVNHCGSTYSVSIDISASTTDLDCSVILGLVADPTSGTAPLTVEWTVTLQNDGDEALGSVGVDLSYDGGATSFQTVSAPPDSGDDGDGSLEPGETWVFLVQTVETADVTVTATAAGAAPSGLVITVPDDPDAQAASAVTVAAAPTTSTTSTTSTTVGPTVTTTSPTTPTTLNPEVAADTLPFTGSGGSGAGTIAVSLLALGAIAIAIARRTEEA